MQGTLLVTPEEMERTAGELDGVRGQVESITQQMLDEARNMTAVWEGEASNAFITKFNTLEDDMRRMGNMVREHVSDLRDMAGIYKNAEAQNEAEAQALPSDAIS